MQTVEDGVHRERFNIGEKNELMFMWFNSFSPLISIGLWSKFFPHYWLESAPLKVHVDTVLFGILKNMYM